jgi:energy-coupling factor transport system substrate-specific component
MVGFSQKFCKNIPTGKGKLSIKPVPLYVFGGIATFLIYGGIVDTSALMMFTAEMSPEAILSTYMMGVPFNLIHAAATVIFLLILASYSMIAVRQSLKSSTYSFHQVQ